MTKCPASKGFGDGGYPLQPEHRGSSTKVEYEFPKKSLIFISGRILIASRY